MKFNKETVINFICVIIGLVAAYFVFQNLHPENFMNKYKDTISLQDTKDKPQEEFVGHPAGDDIPRISGKEDFEELYSAEYVTIEPKSIVETGIVGLKPWADPYKSTKRGKKLRDKVMGAGWDYEGAYIPYYLLECPDGTYILAQLPDSYVKAIKKGESVTLPVGYKKNSAVKYKSLEKICDKYDTSSTEIFYCFDETWYEKNDTVVFIIRAVAAVITLFVLATVLILVCGKVFHIKSEEE